LLQKCMGYNNMLCFSTDIEEIKNVMQADAPRLIKDALAEMYPNCRINESNRVYAAYDNYKCPFLGWLYDKDQEMTFSLISDQMILKNGSLENALWVYYNGEIYSIEGTTEQILDGKKVAKKQEMEFDISGKYIGEVGNRENLVLRYFGSHSTNEWVGNNYAKRNYTYFRDENGNLVINKGTKRFNLRIGNIIEFKATITAHGYVANSEGLKATYINFPYVKKKQTNEKMYGV